MAETQKLTTENETQETVAEEFEKIDAVNDTEPDAQNDEEPQQNGHVEPEIAKQDKEAGNEENQEEEPLKPDEEAVDEEANDEQEPKHDEDDKAVEVKTEKVISDIKKEQESQENLYLYFPQSTHQFLYCDELRDGDNKLRDIHIGDRILGFIIMAFQFALYIYFIYYTFDALKSDLVIVQVADGEDCNANPPIFNCDGHEDHFGTIVLILIALSQFIIADFAGAYSLMQCQGMIPKFAAISIILEGMQS